VSQLGRQSAAPVDDEAKAERWRARFIVHSRRMAAAMLCWSAVQAVGTQWEDGRARAQAQRVTDAPAGR